LEEYNKKSGQLLPTSENSKPGYTDEEVVEFGIKLMTLGIFHN
jgi:hypothetical protein